MADWESIKGLGVISGMAFGFVVGGRIIYWLIEMIKTRDQNQMERDDKRDSLLLTLQLSIVALDRTVREHEEHQQERERNANERNLQMARDNAYRQAEAERREERGR